MLREDIYCTFLHLIFFKATHHQLISMLANLKKYFFKILRLIKLHCTMSVQFFVLHRGFYCGRKLDSRFIFFVHVPYVPV
jgi:hypothetical protein